jgi:hypothetical protein
MERRAVPGELSGRRGVATLARGLSVHPLRAFAKVWRLFNNETGANTCSSVG